MQSKISKPRPLKHSSIEYAGFAANSTADVDYNIVLKGI
jgi:hypothetical protein